MSSTVNVPIFERGRELDTADEALRSAAGGEGGSVLVIEGPAGIGKTRLAEVIVERADSSGFGVHRAQGDELEVGFAYGVLRQLLSSMLEPHQLSDRPSVPEGPDQLTSVLTDGVTGTGSDALGIYYGFYRLLQDLAEGRPRLVCVDDAHWSDVRSLHALRFATRRLEEQSVVTVVTFRPSQDTEQTDLIRQLSQLPAAHRLLLSPLGPDAVSELAGSILGEEPDPDFVRELQRVTGGNPFLVTEVLAGAERGRCEVTTSSDLETQVPDRVIESVQQRIKACGEPAERLAEAVAILGEGSLRDAARLASLDLSKAALASDALAAAQILTTGAALRFKHPLLRRAVAARIPPSQRGLAHSRAARILADVAAPPEEIAGHLLHAPEQADPWIAETLIAAARREQNRGSPETAEPQLARALDEPPPQARRFHVAHELARVRTLLGHPEAIGTAQQALELASDADERAAARLHLARAIGLKRGFRSASDLLEEMRSSQEPIDRDLALQLEAELLGLARLDGESYQQAVARLEELAPQATPARPASVVLLSNLALSALERNESPSKVSDLAGLALSQGWLIEETSLQLLYAITALMWIDQFDAAATACGQIDRAARKSGSVSLSSVQYGLQAMLNLRRGRVPDAAADARICSELALSDAAAEGTAFTRAHLADALMERGEWDEADRALADPAPEERADLNPYYLQSRGRSHLVRHDPTAALRNFVACGDALARRGGVDTPTMFPWRSLAARAQMQLGDHDRARHLAEEELELAETGRIPGAIGEAMTTLGTMEGGSEGEQRLRAALEVLEESPRVLIRIRALTELGSLIRRRGRPKEARPPLKSALDLAHRCGAAAREEKARGELVRAGARPRRSAQTGVDALTPSERRVAQLVGEGLTNRQISNALFVSPRTVSTHLTHIYQKLSVDNRDELGTIAAQHLG